MQHEFGEGQQAVLDENTRLALLSGLAIRYHTALRGNAARAERVSKIPNDPAASRYARVAELTRRAVGAEVPMAFSLEPSNMAVSVHAIKVDTNGAEIPHTSVQIGLVGGLAGEGKASGSFSDEDLSLAVQRIRDQREAGLGYGYPDSVFFPE
jgi:hypothetical protein